MLKMTSSYFFSLPKGHQSRYVNNNPPLNNKVPNFIFQLASFWPLTPTFSPISWHTGRLLGPSRCPSDQKFHWKVIQQEYIVAKKSPKNNSLTIKFDSSVQHSPFRVTRQLAPMFSISNQPHSCWWFSTAATAVKRFVVGGVFITQCLFMVLTVTECCS